MDVNKWNVNEMKFKLLFLHEGAGCLNMFITCHNLFINFYKMTVTKSFWVLLYT